MLSDNSCTNTRLGINIDSSDDTPNVIFSNNAVINPGISYSRVLSSPPEVDWNAHSLTGKLQANKIPHSPIPMRTRAVSFGVSREHRLALC
jgi:hypothetical protein